jgi:Flp pilus assembly protein TadG
MIKSLDQRGVAAVEFCVIALAFFTVIFVIFDLARYAMTMQSLRALASAGARATIIKCYTPALTDASTSTIPSTCTAIDTYFATADRTIAAPFLYYGGLTPTLSTAVVDSALSITASQPGFTMLMPIWGSALDAPSTNTKIPF